MLDDANVLQQRDPQGALGFAAQQPGLLRHDFGIRSHQFAHDIRSVVLSGMGGSAFPGVFISTWPELKVPFVVSRDYKVPAFVDKHTLVIASSYSGNTEETLSALEDARTKGAQIMVLAHGGKLVEIAKAHGDVLAEIPACPQPRMAAFYFYRAIVEVLVAAGLAPQTAPDELAGLAPALEKAIAQWLPDVPEANNEAKQLAQHMVGKTPIIYDGPLMSPAANKWKICVNENAKNTAWWNMYPELSHNEFIGWSSHPIEKPFAVVNLISSFEHPRVLKRFEVTERLLSGLKPAAVNVQAKGESPVEHMLYLILLGDFATLYLACLNGVNPTPVDLVEKFKKELG